MLTRTAKITAIALLVSSTFACQMDSEPETLNRPDMFVPTSGTNDSLVATTLSGLVVDNYGTPVMGAIVECDSLAAPTHTDATGRFEVEVEAGIHSLTIDAAGYLRTYDRVNVTPYSNGDVVFNLVAADVADSFANSDGAAFVIGDAQLTLPPNGFRHADGRTVSGTVEMVATHIANTETTAAEDDSELLIFGSVDVEFYADGELVNLAPGQYAEIEIPVDDSILDAEELFHNESNPVVSAYHFDTTRMQWVEEGYGTLHATDAGLVWRAEVPHFSKWGPGAPKVEVCHHPVGNPENYFIIEVATVALYNAHLDHGDWEVSVEVCDDIDNDCDGELNEDTCLPGGVCVQYNGEYRCVSH